MFLTYHKFKVGCNFKNLKIKDSYYKGQQMQKNVREKNRIKEPMLSFENKEKLSIKIEVFNIILNQSLSPITVLFAGTNGHLP